MPLAIQDQQNIYKALFDSCVDALSVIDPQTGRFIECNDAAVQLHQMGSRARFIDSTPASLSPEFQPDGSRSDERSRHYIVQALSDGPQRFEWLHLRADGSAFPVAVTLCRVMIEERPCVLAIGRDISEHKRLIAEIANYSQRLEALVGERTRELEISRRAAEAANQAKSAFLANVSHELRTPMNAIVGSAYLLAQGKLDADQQEQLQTLQTASEQLIALIDDLLSYTRIESDTLQIGHRVFEPGQLLEGVAARLSERATAKGLALNVTLDSALPARLDGSATQIGQVLHKLADNAVKFTEAGSVRLSAALLQRDRRHWLQIAVDDTGIGLSPDECSGLFQHFSQADDSATRRYGGAGLGLAIARRLVQLMGGEIGVDSEKGRGSRFWFCVPVGVAQAQSDQRSAPGEFDATKWRSLRSRLIELISDDDAESLPLFEANVDLIRAALGPAFELAAQALRRFDFDPALQAIERAG